MEYIPREQNSRADLLSKHASTRVAVNNRMIIQEVINEPSITKESPLDVCSMEQRRDWQQLIREYLIDEKLPKGDMEAKIMKKLASFCNIVAGEFYCRGYS